MSSRGAGVPTFRNDAHALISLQNISARFRGVRVYGDRVMFFFFQPSRTRTGVTARLQGQNGKITKGRVKTGAAPRANFSRRDLITPFGRLQHYSKLLYSARVGAARSPCKAMTRDPIRAEVMHRLQSCYVPRRGQSSIPLRLSL
jgi:hypothetical protein